MEYSINLVYAAGILIGISNIALVVVTLILAWENRRLIRKLDEMSIRNILFSALEKGNIPVAHRLAGIASSMEKSKISQKAREEPEQKNGRDLTIKQGL